MPYELRNARYNHRGTIDVEFLHPKFGWLDTTASPDDIEPQCREIYEQALTGEVAPYQPPTPEDIRVSMPALSPRQMLLALLSINVTQDEVEQTINSIENEDDRARAMIEWNAATSFERNHPTISLVADTLGLPAEQVDALWIWASTI